MRRNRKVLMTALTLGLAASLLMPDPAAAQTTERNRRGNQSQTRKKRSAGEQRKARAGGNQQTRKTRAAGQQRRSQGAGQQGGGAPQGAMRLQFQKMDTSGDGAVSLREFLAIQSAQFRAADANNDGKIDSREFGGLARGGAQARTNNGGRPGGQGRGQQGDFRRNRNTNTPKAQEPGKRAQRAQREGFEGSGPPDFARPAAREPRRPGQ